MSEADAVAALPWPNTGGSLADDLTRLGLKPGAVVLVHTSLSALGWVCGGPAAVIEALESVLTPGGTLVMPAHSGDLSDPAQWAHPPVPEAWWQAIRDTMPAFDRALTPSRGMGAVAEAFRHQRGVVRSGHPQLSFCAWGRHKTEITRGQPWDYPLGPRGPLGRLGALGGQVLLLGVGHGNNTSLHLAENLLEPPVRKETMETAPWRRRNGKTLWRPVANVVLDSGDFEEIGAAFEAAEPLVQKGLVGAAESRLMDQSRLVAFAREWMTRRRH